MEIQLPDFVLAGLYKDKIVIASSPANTSISTEKPVKDKEIIPTKKSDNIPTEKFWLGDNKKNITIIVNDDKNKFVDDNALLFLTNILSACTLNLGDVAIVNLSKTNYSFDAISMHLNSKNVLLFDVNEEMILLEKKLPLFENDTINNVQIIAAPSLNIMMQQTQEAKVLKGKLWNSLKKMFGL